MPRHDPPPPPVPSYAPSPVPVPGGLDDPAYARFAWARFRRVLGGMTLAAALCAGAAWYWIDATYGPLGWVATLALLGGAFFTIVLAGALMGLAFLSSGSGHDEQVRDFDRGA